MKLSTIFFLITVLLFDLPAKAQKQVNEATLLYDIEVINPSNPQAANAFKGATLQVWIKGNNSRTEMHSNFGTETSIHNIQTGKAILLKEYSAQKLMITHTAANWESSALGFGQLAFKEKEPQVSINGFLCKQMEATGVKGMGEVMLYYDPAIVLKNNRYYHSFSSINGLPVKYTLTKGSMQFTYTLRSISYESIPVLKFEWPKSGYRVMTYEENLELNSGK